MNHEISKMIYTVILLVIAVIELIFRIAINNQVD